jgi:hypothetical protein
VVSCWWSTWGSGTDPFLTLVEHAGGVCPRTGCGGCCGRRTGPSKSRANCVGSPTTVICWCSKGGGGELDGAMDW